MMNKTKDERLQDAMKIKATLATLLQSGLPMTPEEEAKACELYAKAVLMVARLT